MSIVLTGANGQVGFEVQRLSRELNLPVKAYTRTECDISDEHSLRSVLEMEKPEMLINAAAYTAVDKAEEEVDQAFAVNHLGCIHLAALCKEMSIPLLHISTDYVFSGAAKSPYTEDDVTSPLNVYGKSKLLGESAILEGCEKSVILRTSWVFGSHGHNFVKTMLRLSNTHPELKIVNDQIGCPTSAKSIATVLLHIARKIQTGSVAWGLYHYCGTPQTSWFGFAEKIFQYLQIRGHKCPSVLPITTDQYPLPATRPLYSVLDCQKIQKTFEVSQPDWVTDLYDVIDEVIADFV